MRWIAPILSFTADEIWRCMPGDRRVPVFAAQWYDALGELPADAELGRDFWQLLMQVKGEVNRELERQRNEGAVGGSLAAQVTVYCNPALVGDARRAWARSCASCSSPRARRVAPEDRRPRRPSRPRFPG